ncbi:MAG: hypothetical protein H7839_08705, partial [Magnetococcus sp. YQC-5]
MTSLAFDTYSYVRKLRDSGMDETQAAVQAEALVELVEDRLASKQDVAWLKRDITVLDTKITDLDTKIDNRFKEMDT